MNPKRGLGVPQSLKKGVKESLYSSTMWPPCVCGFVTRWRPSNQPSLGSLNGPLNSQQFGPIHIIIVFPWNQQHYWVSKTKSLKIFHAISWNILGIFNFHMENFKWRGKIIEDMSCNILPRHQNIFWNQWRFIDFKHGLGE